MYSSIFVNFLIYVHICSSQMVFLSNSSFVHYTASFFSPLITIKEGLLKKIGRIFFPHFSGEYLFATLPITAPRQPIKITYAFWTSIFMFLTDLLQQSYFSKLRWPHICGRSNDDKIHIGVYGLHVQRCYQG